MKDKIECKRCNALILQSTSDKNQGLCMNCYRFELANTKNRDSSYIKSPLLLSAIYFIIALCGLNIGYSGVNILKDHNYTHKSGKVVTGSEADFIGLLYLSLGVFVIGFIVFRLLRTYKKGR